MDEMTATNYRTNYSIIFLIISGVVWVILKRREFFQVQYNSLLLIISQQFQLDWGWPSPASWGVYDNSFSFYADIEWYIERTIKWIAQSQSLAYWTLIIVCSLLTSLVNVGYVTVGHLKFKLKFGFEVFLLYLNRVFVGATCDYPQPSYNHSSGEYNSQWHDLVWIGNHEIPRWNVKSWILVAIHCITHEYLVVGYTSVTIVS